MVPQIKQTNIFVIANLKIPGKKSNFLLVRVDIPSDSKRLVRISFYPSKVDLVVLSANIGEKQKKLGVFQQTLAK